MSLLVAAFVAIAVLALAVGLASVLVHPHVCSLMQGDWSPDGEAEAPRPH